MRLSIINNERIRHLISKCPKYREPKQNRFEEAYEEIQAGIDRFIGRILNVMLCNSSIKVM